MLEHLSSDQHQYSLALLMVIARYLLLNRHYGKYLLEDEGAEGTDSFGHLGCHSTYPAVFYLVPKKHDELYGCKEL